MGMAASQARYLGLTARKTNVEYEGQQVNQARTALANESANTFNDLLRLEVPTAPSTQDYTTIQYSYTDGTEGETITKMSELKNDKDGYNYMISHYHYADIFTGIKSKLSNPQVVFDQKAAKSVVAKNNVEKSGDNFTVNGTAVSQYDSTNSEQKAIFSQIVKDYPKFAQNSITDIFVYTDSGKTYFTTKSDLTKAETGVLDLPRYTVENNVPAFVGNNSVLPYDSTDPDIKAAYEQICKDFPADDIAGKKQIYTWTYQNQTYFATLDDLKTISQSGADKSKPTENQHKLTYYNAQDVRTKVDRTQKAFVDKDESGRFQTIRFEDSSVTYALNTETVTDENAYNDAMNKYNYDMEVYEKRIADINAKTKKLQEQDRTLELRLRQLDTEQEALQTEMEAVKKVIDKNIESTFKTFE